METKGKVNVLLVDDDDEILSTLGKLIESRGWKCFKAPSGEIAMDSFKLNNINAVILDLNLPAIDGFEVLAQMKSLKPNVPVIILTGVGYDKEQVNKALKLGASGYIGKAMPIVDTISTIQRVLGKK